MLQYVRVVIIIIIIVIHIIALEKKMEELVERELIHIY
jgi:hypothetical protein